VFGLLAAAAAFAAVALVTAVVVLRRVAGGEAGTADAVHVGALGVFALVFFATVVPHRWSPSVRAEAWALFAAALAATVAVVTLPQVGVAPVLYILTAVLAAHVLSARSAALLVAGQSLAALLVALTVYAEPVIALTQAVAYLGFQVFALTTTLALLGERRLRHRLALANAELHGARALLEAASRQGERLRIARELHDLIGHHLTALSLQLEVAEHLAEGRAREPVARARAVARLLMADVREVVSDLRERELDLAAVLRDMVLCLPRPQVVLDVPDSLDIDDPERAQVVLRLVQEALTNAVRHGDARRVWISVRLEGDALLVEARDDGRGAAEIVAGSGLRGMTERVQSVGGELRFDSEPAQGFRVRARLPRLGTA
jgi:signal transduction histidine kinase